MACLVVASDYGEPYGYQVQPVSQFDIRTLK